MKRTIYIIMIACVAALMSGLSSCDNLYKDIRKESPYKGTTKKLAVQLAYPEGHEDVMRSGVSIMVEETASRNKYSNLTDENGVARFELTNGIYRIVASDKVKFSAEEILVFNGSADQIRVTDSTRELDIQINLLASKPGKLIFKEIYSGGCNKYPESGTYQYDKYVTIYNNTTDETLYLDGYCFGTMEPYNSTTTNVWVTQDPVTGETVFRDYVPIVQCIWQFPGDGTSFPLEPGQEAVIALNGAIDHHSSYPESVNLNNGEYFVCYNNVYFTNTGYHPIPGNQISENRYLEVLIKTGIANAYTFSVGSPTAILFEIPDSEGSALDYVSRSDSKITKPGGSEICVKIPIDWIEDAVEVFSGSSSNNAKRLAPTLDAAYVMFSRSFIHHSVYRNVDLAETLSIPGNTVVYNYSHGDEPNGIDAEATIRAGGFIIYQDTNNSLNDFHERNWPALHPNSK